MITSTANVQIKKVQQILKKAKVRYEEQVFAVEGIKMFREAPVDRLQKVYLSASFSGKEECREVLRSKDLRASRKVEIVEDKVFKALSDTVTPQGVLCLIHMKTYELKDVLEAEKNPLLLILEDLQDPGNLGTIVRTAEGAGVTGIILTKNSVDLFHPKVIRSTMGSIYRVPVWYTEALTQEILPVLKNKKITSYAAHLGGQKTYDQADYHGGTAFFIGNEGNGLSEALSKKADCLIKIPMAGEVESLNAAMAAGILMYEAARQRRGNGNVLT